MSSNRNPSEIESNYDDDSEFDASEAFMPKRSRPTK